LRAIERHFPESRFLKYIIMADLNGIVSKFQLWVEKDKIIIQPVHVLKPEAAEYECFSIPINDVTDKKIEFIHDGWSNWKKHPVN
jgi:hypothetical protein